jgi:hypothetical protein
MKIANVVYEKELVNHTKVEYVNYFCEPIEYDKLDKTLPTLYVGWSFMKECNPNNEIIQHADILKKKIIGNELYWEFNFEESKASHVKGVESFVNFAPQFYFQPRYNYICLDPVFFQIVDLQGLTDVLPKEKDFVNIVYNFKNEMLYVLRESKIWGIDLKMYAFFKFNIEEIISEVSNGTAVYIYDQDGQMYLNQYKIFPNFPHLKRYMPVIMTK